MFWAIRLFAVINICLLAGAHQHLFAIRTIDSLQKRLLLVSPNEQADIYNQIAWEYSNTNQDSLLVYASKALQAAELDFNHRAMGYAYCKRAIAFRNKGMISEAMQNAFSAITQFTVAGRDTKGLSSAYHTLASIYLQQDNYSRATYYFTLSASFSQRMGDVKGYSASRNYLGMIYQLLKQYDKALQIYQSVYQLALGQGDQNALADAIHNIGRIYQMQGLLDTAAVLYGRALQYKEQLGDRRNAAIIAQNIGSIYQQNGRYKESINYLLKSLNAYEDINDLVSTVSCMNIIASCYTQMQMYHVAERYVSEAASLAEAYRMPSEMLGVLKIRYEIAYQQERFESALEYFKQYKTFSDSLLKQQSVTHVQQLERKYEKLLMESQASDSVHYKEKNELIKKERERNVMQYISIIGMVLLVFVLIFYVMFFIIRKNDNKA